jgi:homoserine dehydrogenase
VKGRRTPLRLLVAGFGNVGRTFAEILRDRDRYPGLATLDVAIVAITTGSHGAVADPRGIDLARALAGWEATGRLGASAPERSAPGTLAAIRSLDYDVLVELSPLSVRERGEPAITHVREALARGRHVITANKGPVAWAHRELAGLAAARGRLFLHEAAVMDGAPVFNLIRNCLAGNVVTRLDGVLNSTTNVVLAAIERGSSLGEGIAEAQRIGVAEADPWLDLDGWDAAVKLAALANAAIGAELVPESVARQSLRGVDEAWVRTALTRGARVKVVAEVERSGAAASARVAARELPLAHPFARVDGPGSVLRIATDLMGTIVLSEEAPDLKTTAYGVIADLFAISRLQK